MKQRVLISVLCLSLGSLAPAPHSACTMLMTATAECAPAIAEPMPDASHCELAASSSAAEQDTLRAGTSDLPCCKVTAAPEPQAGIALEKVTVAPAPASLDNVLQAIPDQAIGRTVCQTELEQFASPPDRQPLLCTFLI